MVLDRFTITRVIKYGEYLNSCSWYNYMVHKYILNNFAFLHKDYNHMNTYQKVYYCKSTNLMELTDYKNGCKLI